MLAFIKWGELLPIKMLNGYSRFSQKKIGENQKSQKFPVSNLSQYYIFARKRAKLSYLMKTSITKLNNTFIALNFSRTLSF